MQGTCRIIWKDLDMPLVEHPAAPAKAPIYIVANARSGHLGQDQRLEPIEQTLRAAGRPFEILKVGRAGELGDAARRAAELARRHAGIVAVAGGDGTINAVVPEVITAGVCLGVIAQGTFNLFARNYGLPLDVAQATEVVLGGHPIPVQVGTVNEHLFLVNASVGLYPRLLQDREHFKRRFGRNRLVAVVSALVTMIHRYRPLRLRVQVDAAAPRTMHTPTLFVGNSFATERHRHRGGG
ncbi:MAG: diacylglycerol kinase family protein [Burkholderiaceae bacterium]